MKENLSLWQFGGFAFTSLMGTILHFLYGWTDNCILVAPFASINESTWEHMKLLYFPMLIFAIIQTKFFDLYQNFWCVKLLGIIIGLILIPILFYTYNGVLGTSGTFVNIAIFFIAAGIAFLVEWFLFKNSFIYCKHSVFAFVVICFICLLFIIFTFYPPKIPLFQDPLNK